MPVNREELAKLFALEPVELARIVVCNNVAFAEIARQLDARFTNQWRNQDWLWVQDRATILLFKRKIFSGIKRTYYVHNNRIHDLICGQFDWCQYRNDPTFELVGAIADTLLDIFAMPGLPALVVYFIKRKVLDELCGCN